MFHRLDGKKYSMSSLILLSSLYNVAKYIERCLNSCLEQSYVCIVIICVDDGTNF
ncbi:MAG: glycosyltransferase family A protein [Candidatus Thiodiazotropha taylori]